MLFRMDDETLKRIKGYQAVVTANPNDDVSIPYKRPVALEELSHEQALVALADAIDALEAVTESVSDVSDVIEMWRNGDSIVKQ